MEGVVFNFQALTHEGKSSTPCGTTRILLCSFLNVAAEHDEQNVQTGNGALPLHTAKIHHLLAIANETVWAEVVRVSFSPV